MHGLRRVENAESRRLFRDSPSIGFVRFFHDFSVIPDVLIFGLDVRGSTEASQMLKVYVVQTGDRRLSSDAYLMASGPWGSSYLDPTCGSGTTAYVAEQWGRRWIAQSTPHG